MKALISASEIEQAVRRLGLQLTEEYRGRPLTVLGVLTGSIVFLADLIRQIEVPLRVGLISASSYRDEATTPGELQINSDLLPDLSGRDVLLLDDIFDTGHTLVGLTELIQKQEPASLRSAVLLWKTERQQVELTPDYHCFQIPNEFVVGYGLDHADEHRHLPFIGVLESQDL